MPPAYSPPLEEKPPILDIKESVGKPIDATTKRSGEMESEVDTHRAARNAKTGWVKYVLIALVFEKIIQHIVVTIAFYFNWGDIGSSVVVNPNVLMVLGAVVAVLFILSLWGMVTQQKWAINLVMALALFDIIGEFVAQGTLTIAITVSFLVATILLILTLLYRRQELKRTV
jgi:hypothetical protein